MWLLMYLCYGLTFLTWLSFTLVGIQGVFGVTVLGANQITFSFLATILYFFTQTLMIFFFVGTGINVNEYVKEHHLDEELIARTRSIKRWLSPQNTFNILLYMGQSIALGAAFAGSIPWWIYWTAFGIAYVHFLWVVALQHRGFRENTEIIVDMAHAAEGRPQTNPSPG